MPISTWPAVLLKDARDLLHGLDSETLIQIAEELEQALREYSQPYNFPPDKSHWIWSRVLPGWTSVESISSSENIRKNFEDLNLFLAFYRPRDFQADSRLNFVATEWQLLAVLAIWKLIDAFDASFRCDGMERAPINRKPVDALGATAALLMEAQAAIATAIQRKQSSEHFAEMEKRRIEIEVLQRQLRAASGGNAKGERSAEARRMAFELSTTTSKKFHNQLSRAEWLSRELKARLSFEITPSSVRRWLREEGLFVRKKKS
jgi:hypothetical protein